MIKADNGKRIEDIYFLELLDGALKPIKRTITLIYYNGRLVWELIIGFIWTINNYFLVSKDNYIIKCKDQ